MKDKIKVVGFSQAILGVALLAMILMNPPSAPVVPARNLLSLLMIAAGVFTIRYAEGQRTKNFPLLCNVVVALVCLVSLIASFGSSPRLSALLLAERIVVLALFVSGAIMIFKDGPEEEES